MSVYVVNRPVHGVGFLPLLAPFLPEIVIGTGALIAGTAAGYTLGRPEVDAAGNRVPGTIEVAATQVGKGIGDAIKISAVLVIGYLIWRNSRKK